MSDAFLIEAAGPIARITLNRPQVGNILTIDALRAMSGALTELGASAERRAIVIAGAGADFCLGRDTSGGPPKEKPSALQMRANLTSPILDVYRALRETPVPVIAAVQGHASGLGCAFISGCDMAIATSNARFRLPEMEKDLPPTLAISALLHRVPPKTIAYMVYSLAEIDAQTALATGFISRVVPDADLAKAVDELCAELAHRSRAAVCTVKEYLRSALYMEPGGASDLAGISLANVLSSR
ncbi:MAG: enoyl-CoA hydratase/isomerase family protein [Betaproteobacteria bacterium]|nr:enoyl-CoA hydratase/isomerase family protein [Betaproteobacteria bacterium]